MTRRSQGEKTAKWLCFWIMIIRNKMKRYSKWAQIYFFSHLEKRPQSTERHPELPLLCLWLNEEKRHVSVMDHPGLGTEIFPAARLAQALQHLFLPTFYLGIKWNWRQSLISCVIWGHGAWPGHKPNTLRDGLSQHCIWVGNYQSNVSEGETITALYLDDCRSTISVWLSQHSTWVSGWLSQHSIWVTITAFYQGDYHSTVSEEETITALYLRDYHSTLPGWLSQHCIWVRNYHSVLHRQMFSDAHWLDFIRSAFNYDSACVRILTELK